MALAEVDGVSVTEVLRETDPLMFASRLARAYVVDDRRKRQEKAG